MRFVYKKDFDENFNIGEATYDNFEIKQINELYSIEYDTVIYDRCRKIYKFIKSTEIELFLNIVEYAIKNDIGMESISYASVLSNELAKSINDEILKNVMKLAHKK